MKVNHSTVAMRVASEGSVNSNGRIFMFTSTSYNVQTLAVLVIDVDSHVLDLNCFARLPTTPKHSPMDSPKALVNQMDNGGTSQLYL